MKRFITGVILVVLSVTGNISTAAPLVCDVEASDMRIDGDLAEWKSFNAPFLPVENYYPLAVDDDSPSANDIKASFAIAFDSRYVYFAVNVIDDIVISGESAFGYSHGDDAIEICFDGDITTSGNSGFTASGGQLLVVGDKTGLARIEGIVPCFMQTSIPYFWETRGVRAGYRQTTDGYSVEMAIPLALFGSRLASADTLFGVNIRVFDNDGNGTDSADGVLSWNNDPKHTSFRNTTSYRTVALKQVVDAPCSFNPNKHITDHCMLLYRNIGLNQAPGEDFFLAFFSRIDKRDWEDAVRMLEPYGKSLWAAILLDVTLMHAGKYSEAVAMVNRHATAAPESFARLWMQKYPYYYGIKIKSAGKHGYITYQYPQDHAKRIFEEHLKFHPDDTDALNAL